jgi:hypothetical protein
MKTKIILQKNIRGKNVQTLGKHQKKPSKSHEIVSLIGGFLLVSNCISYKSSDKLRTFFGSVAAYTFFSRTLGQI